MNYLDFISGPPRIYIFHKSSNKTNLGGVLTFFYAIIVILIIVSYLYDFYHNASYEYSYFYKNINKKDREGLKEKYNLNPITNFTIEVRDSNNTLVNDKFIFSIFQNGPNLIDFNGTISTKVDEYSTILFYKCSYKEPDNICLDEESQGFELNIYYNSKILDHENSYSPVRNSSLNFIQIFHSDYMTMMETYWETYNYEEKKGIMTKIFDYIFDNQNNYTFGQITHSQVYSIGKFRKVDYNDDFCLLPMLAIHMNNQLTGIHLYKRQAISIWDYLSNICALGLTIYSGLTTIFKFIYSKNYDNYKVMETILSKIGEKNSIIRLYNNKSYKALNDINLKENLIKNNNNDNNSINDEQNLKSKDINDKDENELNFKLPKLIFLNFVFNNVYCKCCCFLQKQKLIDSCNEVLYKYLSIENLLYSQIKFESLMKDYKWNNPALNLFHENKEINELKKYL